MVMLSRGLLASFVATVTLWYFLSPYGVRPHPSFHADMEKMIATRIESEGGEGRWVENWTKWRLYIGDMTVYPQQRVNIDNMTFPLLGVFEWRTDYTATVFEQDGELTVSTEEPWGATYGLYHHYTVRVDSGRRVMFLPYFMYGAPQSVLESLYGGVENMPTIGMMAGSPGGDRVIVQCFMNIVILTVILLLWANNPPKKTKEE